MKRWRLIILVLLGLSALAGLLFYRLGSLTYGLSAAEVKAASAAVGWHGIYHDPFYLPLKLVRSVVFVIFPAHGHFLTRLPNAVFGGLAVVSFAWLVQLWHGTRTAALSSILFAAGAWTLHASRLASFDVMYLWAMPTLLLTHWLLQKYDQNLWIWWGSAAIWLMILYIPGMVWFVLLEVLWQRKVLVGSWQHFGGLQRLVYALIFVLGLPLLLLCLARPGNLVAWLGFPSHFNSLPFMLKSFLAVPVHLLIRGPQYSEIWLGRLPVLDAFTLAACLTGVYFYFSKWKSSRSRLLASWLALGFVLAGLSGPVSLSLLVPLLYVLAATGIAYLLHEWMKVFPYNPFARSLGLSLIITLVAFSCIYNLRTYFIAWPHNQVTRTVFREQP